jgi:hypothetical protein
MSDPNTIVTGAQTVSDLTPIINSVVGAIILGIGGLIAALIQRYTGYIVAQTMMTKVEGLATQYAQAEVAKAADSLATTQFDVKSPLVKKIVDQIAYEAPKEMSSLGLSTADVQSKVLAAFGKLQASMTTIPAAAPQVINVVNGPLP